MNNIVSWLSDHWLKLVGYCAGSMLIIAIHTFRIGSLLPGASMAEKIYIRSADTIALIAESPLAAPHKLLYLVLHELGFEQVAVYRLATVFIGVVSIILFYALIRSWHTERIAVFGTALFAGSSWFLHYDRLALPHAAMIALILALISISYIASKHRRRSSIALTVYAACFGLLLYFPGTLYIAPIMLGWQWRSLQTIAGPLKNRQLFGIISLMLLIVAPLGVALSMNQELIKKWLLLPEVFPTIPALGRQTAELAARVLYRNPSEPVYGLGNLPLLDVFGSVMALLGLYYWERQMGWRRLLVAVLSIAITLLSLGFIGNAPEVNAMLLPFTYILVACGITVLLQQWFTVFPRNPLARSVGIALITFVVGVSALYHASRYFIAWPNAPETKRVFMADK